MKRGVVSTVLAAVVLAALAASAALAAQPAGTVTVVARGLDNPRHVSVAASGAIYVAEAGSAGPMCDPKEETCVGLSGAVTRIVGGAKTRVLGGLVSAGGKDGSFVAGAHAVSVTSDGTLFVAMTGRPECQQIPLPPRAAAQAGRVLVKSGPAPLRTFANVERLECAKNFDGTDRNSNPYAVLALGKGRVLVVDAGANALYDVTARGVKLLATFPKQPGNRQSVPTAIAKGPDGAFYVGEFGGENRQGPLAAGSRVFRVVPGEKPTVHARGFQAITGLAFGRDGSMYVTEMASSPANFEKLRGDVVRVGTDGTRTRLGTGKLFAPAGGAIGPDGALYVSNWSVFPGRGEVVRIAT
jgi:sugar lactone lactonase YvrE